MTIRHSLLAILDEGPCYGYQLRTEFARRSGGVRALNVGQVYATLERLERDGLAAKAGAGERGHVTYAITPEGSAVARAWLAAPSSGEELTVKLALAVTLPGADAAALIRAQRAHTSGALAVHRAEPAGDAARTVVVTALIAAAEAQLAWLDQVERLVEATDPVPLAIEMPRRGRPAVSRTAE